MIDERQKRGLCELRLDHGRLDGEDGLVREYDLPLVDGDHIAREAKAGEILKIVLREDAERAKIGDVVLVEMQAHEPVGGLFHTGRDRIGDELVGAEEDIECRHLLMPALIEIPLPHRDLIEVGQKR